MTKAAKPTPSPRQRDVLQNLADEGPLALINNAAISATQASIVERGWAALSRDKVLSITDAGRAHVIARMSSRIWQQ
jgi:hypothetical protein